ncbi:NfeD family protein [Candidatus Roizmanbacteria bacterium]|nr:NfeD family protein [Candidatus Roizmanbacteria bacterium]
MNINWLLVFAGLGAILLELFIGVQTGFDLVLIGIALMVGGGVGEWSGNGMLGVSITAILSFLYIFVGRQYIKQKLAVPTKHTNVELIIGKTGRVEKTITPHRAGQMKIGNEVWRATADTKIEAGSMVKIEEVSGVSVRVVKYK